MTNTFERSKHEAAVLSLHPHHQHHDTSNASSSLSSSSSSLSSTPSSSHPLSNSKDSIPLTPEPFPPPPSSSSVPPPSASPSSSSSSYRHQNHDHRFSWFETAFKPPKLLKRRLQRFLGDRNKETRDHNDKHKNHNHDINDKQLLKRSHTHHHEHHVFRNLGKRKEKEPHKKREHDHQNNDHTIPTYFDSKSNKYGKHDYSKSNTKNYKYLKESKPIHHPNLHRLRYHHLHHQKHQHSDANEVEMRSLSPAVLTPTVGEENRNREMNEMSVVGEEEEEEEERRGDERDRQNQKEEVIKHVEGNYSWPKLKLKSKSKAKTQSVVSNTSSFISNDKNEHILHQDRLLTVVEHLKQFKVVLRIDEQDHNHIKIRINSDAHTISITGHCRTTRQLESHELARRLDAFEKNQTNNNNNNNNNNNQNQCPLVDVHEQQRFERIVRLPRSVNLATLSSNMGTDCLLTLCMDKYFGCFHAMNSPNH